PVKPYATEELDAMFAGMDKEEALWCSLFLNSGCRDAEVQNTEYADFSWEKNTLHVQAKPWRNFRLKGKKKNRSAKDRFIPLPAKLVKKIKARMEKRDAQPHDLLFPNGNGKVEGHFLRKLKAIAKKAGVEGAELHRYRLQLPQEVPRSEEHTSELQSRGHLVCRLLLEKKKAKTNTWN